MIVIIGGGISGLSAAWFLQRSGQAVEVLEAGDRYGGVIASDRIGGYLVERGPNSTLQKPGVDGEALSRLVADTGLAGQLVETGEAGQKRYVLRGGRLRALPTTPPGFLATGLFSWRAKLRLAREPFIGAGVGEETIADFVERRLGREFLDYAVEPFISGVYAGDPAALSVRAAVPRIHELEQTYGSLIRGAIARRKIARGAGAPTGRMISFEQGMAMLPEAITRALPAGACRAGCRVVALRPSDEGWNIHWESAADAGVTRARTVVLAAPAPAAAHLLEPLSSDAARILRHIAYAPVASVALGYQTSQLRRPLDGFGFLSPRKEGQRTLGGLFSSSLFAARAPAGRALITAFIGGTTDPGALDLDDDALSDCVSGDLARTVGIRGTPDLVEITRHRQAIPQYTIGHLDRIGQLDRIVDTLPGLHLRANWRDGVSVADCIRNSEMLARRITAKTVSSPETRLSAMPAGR